MNNIWGEQHYVCMYVWGLSQRGRAKLRVMKYFAKSLKVTENGIIRKLEYGFLFVAVSLAVLTQYTDRQTSQTDTARRHWPRSCIATRTIINDLCDSFTLFLLLNNAYYKILSLTSAYKVHSTF